MTTRQRISIMAERWPAACQTQGWDPKDRDLRLRVISEAVGRPITTMAELDNARDMDAVFARLGFLADNVARTIEVENPEPGERRRYLHLIRRHSGQLADYGADPLAYALAVARDRFGITRGLSTIEDCTTEELRQLMMTLWARLCAHRRAGKIRSLDSAEEFPDQVEFPAETDGQLVTEPF